MALTQVRGKRKKKLTGKISARVINAFTGQVALSQPALSFGKGRGVEYSWRTGACGNSGGGKK